MLCIQEEFAVFSVLVARVWGCVVWMGDSAQWDDSHRVSVIRREAEASEFSEIMSDTANREHSFSCPEFYKA